MFVFSVFYYYYYYYFYSFFLMEQLPHFFVLYCFLRVNDVRVAIKVVHINLNVIRLFLRSVPAL